MGFATLATEDWRTIVALGSPRTYPAGRTVFREGDHGGVVLALRTGRVKICTHTPAGREVVVAIKGRGEFVGELSALDGRPRSATAIAVERSEVLVLSADAFNTFLEGHPRFAVHLLRLLAAHVRAADRLLTEREAGDMVSRVVSRLLQLGEDVREHTGVLRPVVLSLSQDDLAAWVGASREATSRALGHLRSAGLVDTGRHRITVLDPAVLSQHGA
jgi:CRP/FNR family cyclic AMP-dependent transcriptional regulator